jgi:hypothetical protein
MDAKQPEMETITRKIDEIGQLQKNMMMSRVEVFSKSKKYCLLRSMSNSDPGFVRKWKGGPRWDETP